MALETLNYLMARVIEGNSPDLFTKIAARSNAFLNVVMVPIIFIASPIRFIISLLNTAMFHLPEILLELLWRPLVWTLTGSSWLWYKMPYLRINPNTSSALVKSNITIRRCVKCGLDFQRMSCLSAVPLASFKRLIYNIV